MRTIVTSLFYFMTCTFRTRMFLQMEILALRHQLTVYQQTMKRPQIKPADRILWVWLSRIWSGWRDSLVFVKPGTVIAWQRKRFREHWANLSRHKKPGRPRVAKEIQELIRNISLANPMWGSPRILGELQKLGIEVAQSTIEKYRIRQQKSPSPTWKSFLENHARDLVGIDFFTVPTVKFRVLFVFVVLAHHRRRVVHFNVTEHPTAEWTAQQMIEAFPWNEAPVYLLRDRDAIYGKCFQRRILNMGLKEVLTAYRSPWQNPYTERVIGSIRRDCLNHVIVLNEKHLKRILNDYFEYYHRWRTHLSLDMDSPETRVVQSPSLGRVVKIPEVGGLHHHYERRAA